MTANGRSHETMSIYDRDYMRRRSDGNDEPAGKRDASLDAFFNRFLAKHPRFFVRAGIALATLFVIGLIVLKFLAKGR
jgi:hypothetical protein